MKFDDIEMLPGTIIDVDDPEKLGRVKCIIPSIFESSADKDIMPWIPQFGMSRYQAFSKMMPGAKVWVMQVKSNYNEFYYLPIMDKINTTKEFLEAKYDLNPEIVYMRDNAGQVSKITYDDEEGCMIYLNEFFINLTPEGDIHCHGNGADVHVKSGNVYIGSDEDGGHEPAVFGDKLSSILGDLYNAMTKLQSAAASSPYDAKLADGFGDAVKALKPYDEIKCKKTKVN